MFKIVLYQPEIPANTGNIGRLCVGADSELHIIKPMRFMINDKYLKRAGLDYWQDLKLFLHDDLAELQVEYPQSNIYYCTTKTENKYTEPEYKAGDIFVFGPESRGIPEEILLENKDNTITIPMSEKIRSINLSNSVAIVLYEALRQVDWEGDENVSTRRIIC
ncbi:MAG: tRNA (cytidine(34)-2'-O)-methyltransferase [Candidatus Stygibacter australis]|nr:tRNA (cytidine(34)-2'-O)-methyltransferase [Candidatus Stygibacter australis]MDP8323443.1 tRNA (cytidine(34)-2'-O)-methyltransferase [Candidatus Stygibacter australis]